jgi:nitrous oxidase accessory protein NosD
MTRFAWRFASIALFTASHARADEPRTLRAGTDAAVAKAFGDASPGDTILVADGTYTDMVALTRSGKAGQPITLKAEHPGKAVFTRKGPAARIEGSFLRLEGIVFDSQYGDCTCVRISGKNVHLVGCEVRRAGSTNGPRGGDGIQFFDSADCLVEKCHVHHCLATKDKERVDSHGVRITHSRDVILRGCRIEFISGDCVQADPDRKEWDNVLIEGCTLVGGRVAADDPYPHPGFVAGTCPAENAVDTKCPKAGPRLRITIRDCEVSGFRGSIGNAAAFNIKESCDAVIDRCTIRDCEIGLRLRAPAQVRVTNCVLHDNDTHCRYEDGIPKLYIAHCTFGRATGKGRGAFQEQRPSPDLRVQACLFLGEKPKQAQEASNRSAAAAAFIDVEKADYRLTAALPSGGKGPATDTSEVKIDRAAVPRPADEVPDAGAYRFRSK